LTGGPIIADDAVGILTADIEVAIRAEDDTARRVEFASRDDEIVDIVPARIKADDASSVAAADHVEVAVRPEKHAPRTNQPAAKGAANGEDVQESSRVLIVPQDRVVIDAADKQVGPNAGPNQSRQHG
jgi:hypothetical protein